MIKLRHTLAREERELFIQYLGETFEVLSEIEGECYVLNVFGELYYNDCFAPTDNERFQKQTYRRINPDLVMRYYSFYLAKDDTGIWYRGRKDISGNFEFDCSADQFEDIAVSL